MRPNLSLKELRNHIVCVHHKNRGKHKQHFKLFFESKSKRRLVQTNVHFKFFNLSESKRLTNLPAAAKDFSSSVYCYRCNLLRWMLLVSCDNWETLYFLKVFRYCEIFSTAILSFFFLKQLFWIKVRILRYPQNSSALLILMLMLSSKIKLSFTIIIQKFW